MQVTAKTIFGFTVGNLVNFVTIIVAAAAVCLQGSSERAHLKAEMIEVKALVLRVPVIENDVSWLKRQAIRGGVAFIPLPSWADTITNLSTIPQGLTYP
jgi:hypothetical protein